MATQRGASSSKKRTPPRRTGTSPTGQSAAGPASKPDQPAWRQPPSRPREQVRQTVVKRVARPPKSRRVSERLPAMPRGLVWRSAAALLVLLLAAAGIGLLLTRDLFLVTSKSTQIRGNQRIPAELIYANSKVDQRNIFRLLPAKTAGNVRDIPGLAAATVHLRLPNEVIIDVSEQMPLVAWQGITTTMWVAEDSSLVPMVGAPPALVLKDPTGAALEEDNAAPESSSSPAGVMKVGRMRHKVLSNLAALRSARPDITEFYYGRLEGLYFRSSEGVTVYLGDDGQVARKLALLEATQREIEKRNLRVQTIDLRFEYEGLATFR
jgi:hypothetical protein